MIKAGKNILYGLWGVCVLIMIVCYFVHPELFTPEYFIEFILSFQTEILLVYIILTFVRGFFLIPSTVFVIAGGLLFPDQLLLVLIVSMAGVLFSATALYYFSDAIGFSQYLEKACPNQVAKWKARLNKPGSTLFVVGWSFFPLVPTDLICYAAGIVKLPYKYMIAGVFVGELVLDICYVFFGSNISKIIIS